jgi:flagellar hook protein FlgE
VGTLQPVVLSAFTSPPEPTSAITAITNLNSQDTSNSVSLFNTWDATATSPIGDASYGYQTSIQVYDSLGRSHDVTVYYDKALGSEYDTGTNPNIGNTWEYIVASNPADDLRAGFAASTSRGILMRGTVAFNATSGALESQTAFVWDGAGDPDVNANWIPATNFSPDGYPEVNAQFVALVDQPIAAEFGSRSTTSAWVGGAANVGAIAADGLPTSSWEPQALTSTQYASSSTTIYQTQNGYGTGFLSNVSVGTDGIMVGHYSNGQILNLFRVGVAKFNNQQALSKVGGNLWSATRESGDAITGHPGENGLGRISSNSLEQSNVDIAAEFVKMITTERGFQANSRIITTVDNMLQELINLKR